MDLVKVLACALCLTGTTVEAEVETAELVPLGQVEFSGTLAGARDLSAAQRLGDWLVVASDENAVVQFLERSEGHDYRFHHALPLHAKPDVELDIEALALDGEQLYALGSHSRYRRRVRPDAEPDENSRRFSEVRYREHRDSLFRIAIDPDSGQPRGDMEHRSLRAVLESQPVLAPFLAAPGKENGVDFEGLAVVDGLMLIGFRGPVLRHNYLPVLALRFDDIDACADPQPPAATACELRFLNLRGRGVRGMHTVTGGVLLIAGPVGDGRFDYHLYFWDGRDCFPSREAAGCRLVDLGIIPGTHDAGAEGIAVLSENATGWEVLVVYDGVVGGKPARFRVPRPEPGIRRPAAR